MTRTVGIDCDGVLHRYSRGYADGTMYDHPVDGALAAVRKLMNDYAVFVFTARDPLQVAEWIQARIGVPVQVDLDPLPHDQQEFWTQRGVLLVTRRKIPACAYIDDRAIPFRTWDQALEDLEEMIG